MKNLVIVYFYIILITSISYAQSGNGHAPNNLLSYKPAGYSIEPYERQATSDKSVADNTITDTDNTDIFVNFIYDTSSKNVYLVYTSDGSTIPDKTNGITQPCAFNNFNDPNRTWLGTIPQSSNYATSEVRYVIYISDSDLASAWGRITSTGYSTSWTEGDSYFSYTASDDDDIAPAFNNAIFVEGTKKLRIDITDASSIYDDGTGSSGQGIYMIYDDDGEISTNYDGEVQLSLLSGDTYETDNALPYSSGTTITYKVFAYDNDFDNSLTTDRKQGTVQSSIEYPVPVELTSFTVNKISNNTILNWTTATEVNNYGFEIEASTSSATDWTKIGFVAGHGNSNSPKDYNFAATDNAKYYRLKQVDTDGGFEYSDVVEVEMNLSYKLSQNHPNPFNPTTEISFTIPQASKVNITIYNALGQAVAEVANREFNAGNHSLNFNAANLTSGIYFYRLESAEFSQTMKMILMK
ncbi:MAG: T9SS type A sorting domain-containing protein [Bacteroidetes bacterium]|nr:T9SS type A sorting domain-containing protein [Bacteroidota bacterium]MBU1114646.1 T9SS type A sorting domain-containing protein [Bacteroidota bacterium]MBU1798190.1 T9SS type A sorting domain-containing protein [Bacteroidota bacterium]